MEEYDGRQFVGIDLHRRRSVIVRMTSGGEPARTPRFGGSRRYGCDSHQRGRPSNALAVRVNAARKLMR